MNWVKALSQKELSEEGAMRMVRVGGKDILFVFHDGEIYAVDNACPHLRLPLQLGWVTEDHALHCPWHRSAFDLRSGDVKEWSPWPPGLGRVLGKLSREKTLPVFPTRVEDGNIWVGLEEPRKPGT
jgi:nitrite reductase/ring-hydroxylating ferredoxin subunit